MKNVSPPLAALGLSLAAHTWLLSGGGRDLPPKAQHSDASVMQVRWQREAAQNAIGRTQPASSHARVTAPAAIPAPDMPPADTPRPLEAVHFWLPHEVDLRALPMQAPDPTPLDGLPWPAEQALRLRLSITAQGEVVDVASLDDPAPPGDLLAALQTMFRATAFMPARRQGHDVASLQDIDIAP